MRIVDLYKNKTGRPIISFEFSRAKDQKARAALDKTLDILKSTGPDYVSVTFGAGGSTREGSFELIDTLKNEKGFGNVVGYIAGVGLGKDELISVMEKFKQQDLDTVFVIRGDAPEGDTEYEPKPDAMAHASDLLSFIKKRYDFCLGAAGYPEGHVERESMQKDLEYLKLKVDCGAEYVVAQYFYDNRFFYDFIEKCIAIGINVPIIPGIMPIYSVKMTQTLANLCGATITDKVRKRLDSIDTDDKNGVVEYGIELAIEQCRDLIKNNVMGLHFYTMNRGKTVDTVITNLRAEGLV